MKDQRGTVIDRPDEQTIEQTELDKVDPNLGDYAVQCHNNEVTSFMDVVGVFVISCGYDQMTAERFAMKIHNDKVALVFWGAKKRCEEVIRDFKGIGVTAVLVGGKDGDSN